METRKHGSWNACTAVKEKYDTSSFQHLRKKKENKKIEKKKKGGERRRRKGKGREGRQE